MEPIPEARVLALAGLLQAAQFVVMAIPANLELGPGKTMSPRDPGRLGRPLMEQVSPVTGRLHRALSNHFEGLVLFTLAVVASRSRAGRAASRSPAPGPTSPRASAYAFGWVPWRSVVWGLGWAATVAMMLAAVL